MQLRSQITEEGAEEGTTTKDPKTTGDSRGTEAFTKETEVLQGSKGEGWRRLGSLVQLRSQITEEGEEAGALRLLKTISKETEGFNKEALQGSKEQGCHMLEEGGL